MYMTILMKDYNVIENIYKARNFNFVSDVGISESVISYFASDKSKHNSQVISKQGGKGTRGTLETFIQRSMNSLIFALFSFKLDSKNQPEQIALWKPEIFV